MSQLILRRHPFDQAPGAFPVKSGQTLGAMLREGAQGSELSELLVVSINGVEVPRHFWDRVRPKEGTVIHVTGTVHGGSNNQVLRSVLMIVVTVFAMWATGGGAAAAGWGTTASFGAGSFGAYALGAAISIVGTLAINALIPPPKPGEGGGTDGRWNMLTGSQNGISPYGPIPFVLGESRYYPPHAAMPYVETMGTDSYQRLMFDLGYLTPGATVTDLKIGDTPISAFEGVQYEVTTTPTLYTADINEEALSIILEDGDVDQRTTALDTDEISLDIVFPQGLFGMNDEGSFRASNVFFNFEYRLVGAPTWTQVTKEQSRRSAIGYISNPDYTSQTQFQQNPFFCRRDDRKPFAGSIAWKVPPGQYEVRVKRYLTQWGGNGNESSKVGLQCQWASLRSIRATNPSTTGTTKLAMRIKSSEQLNGVLQSLSCLVKQKIPVWDRATDTWSDQFTCNTAWVTYWLMTQCPGVSNHASAARMDLERLADYADFCTAHALETRRTVDSRSTMRELIDDVLAASLGSVCQTNGKYGVVFDSNDSTPSMVFTELEAGNVVGRRMFYRVPQALRVRFLNPLINWRPDEIVVLDDGYSFRGIDARGQPSTAPAPETFETVDLRTACYPQQAWRLGRFHLAQAKFRASTYSFSTDISALGVTRGDVVDLQAPATEWGDGAGFVVSVQAGGPTGAATVVLSDEVETDPAKTYRAQVRRVSGGQVIGTEVYDVTPHSPITRTFYFATMPTLAPEDVVVIGETGRVSQRLIITGIAAGQDLNFSATAVPYDARLAPYWANPPASMVSEATGSVLGPPAPPVITVVTTNPVNDPTDDSGVSQSEVQLVINDDNHMLMVV